MGPLPIVAYVGVALTSVVLISVLRRERPEFGTLVALGAGAMLFLLVLPQLVRALRLIDELTLLSHVRIAYIDVVLRIIGIAYLAEFAAQVARDAGEGALAQKVELGGKVLILVLAVPIVGALVHLVLGVQL